MNTSDNYAIEPFHIFLHFENECQYKTISGLLIR